jgi:hypothetical protein
MYEHYVAFEATKEGSRSLSLFIKNVPEEWHADFDELFSTGEILIQYFRTVQKVDRFVATPLARDLPGSVDWIWNAEIEQG